MRFTRTCLPVLLALAAVAAPGRSSAQIAIGASIGASIDIAPPALPVYVQPPLPAPGYLWTPGYWAYGAAGYYWVPGTWVQPPSVGLLWTPGFWGWNSGFYAWHAGYWGPHVGFYGGVNYGFGYGGVGYLGGRWEHGAFSYNRTVNNFGGTHVTNVYNETIVNRNVTRVSFNGGAGGIQARPTAREQDFAREHHEPPTGEQAQHEHAAGGNHALLASENHGRPPIAATSRPGEFNGHGTVAAAERHAPDHPHATPAAAGPHRQPSAPHPADHPHATPVAAAGPHPHPSAPHAPNHQPITRTAAAKPHPHPPAPHPPQKDEHHEKG